MKAHDEIIVWLLREANGYVARTFLGNRMSAWDDECRRRLARLGATELPEYPGVQFTHKLEAPLLENDYGRRTIRGYADLKVIAHVPTVYTYRRSGHHGPDDEYEIGATNENFWFEVKPKIVLDELIRQLRRYELYTGNSSWTVVSPDAKFESIIKAQGFHFLRYPDTNEQGRLF